MSDITDFDLGGLNLVYAVSQAHLNASLAETLLAEPVTVEWYYDQNGNPTTPADAYYAFQGTLGPVYDDNGNLLVPIIDLSQSQILGLNTVGYNMTFATASFTVQEVVSGTPTYTTYTQTQPASGSSTSWIWQIAFSTALTLSELADAPAALQAQLEILNGQYDQIFTLQQVFADLTTAAISGSSSSSKPDGIPNVIVWNNFTGLMGQYLSSSEAQGSLPLAFAATIDPPSPAASPALLPTAADFVVLPDATTPDASALVFAMMTQGAAMPGDLGTIFADVSLISVDNSQNPPVIADGVAMVSAAAVGQTLIEAVSATGTTFPAAASQYLQVTCNFDYDGYPVLFTLTQGDTGALTATDPTATTPAGCYAQFISDLTSSDSISGSVGGLWTTASGNTEVQSSFQLLGTVGGVDTSTQITISGDFRFDGSTSYNADGNGSYPQLPWTDCYWSMGYTLANDSTTGAILFASPVPNFDQPPSVESSDLSSWEEVLAQASGVFNDDDVCGAPQSMQTAVSGIETLFSSSFASANLFVLPGSGVFTFSGVFLNSAYAMVNSLAYQAVSAPAPALQRAREPA